MEQLADVLGKRPEELAYYGTHAGAEVDLFWTEGTKRLGAEMKISDSPRTSRSMHTAIEDLGLDRLFVVYPGARSYDLTDRISVVSISELDRCRGE